MKKRTLKLDLSKETLLALDPEDSFDIVGGVTLRASRCATCSSNVVCCATGGEANSCPCS